MTITCSIGKQTLDGGPNQTHNLFVRSNQVFFYPSFVGENLLNRRFSSKRKGVLPLQATNYKLYKTLILQSSTNYTTNHKTILENTSINYKLQATKLKHKLILQCKYTTTLKFYIFKDYHNEVQPT